MDRTTADRLTQLTSAFYAKAAESFSATRQGPWPGWQRALKETGLATQDGLRLLDVACGNLRFERFLAEERTAPFRVLAIDNCDGLALVSPVDGADVSYVHLDVATELASGTDLACVLGTSAHDAAVCFGFMHHLPLVEQREGLLRALVGSVAPGGYVVVTLWQLSKSERLLGKALETTQRATEELGITGLGQGDYLLGWQDRTDIVRYCHNFTESEIDALVASTTGAAETARFSADGQTGDLNRYLVLQVN